MATNIESISHIFVPHGGFQKYRFKMSQSKEDAKALHNDIHIQESANPATDVVYTDRSGIEGKIGAAV
jgi:hypothetical protein